MFFKNCLLFNPAIQQLAQHIIQCTEWPTVDDYNQWLKIINSSPISETGKPIQFVPQADRNDVFTEQYEPRIYLTGEVQTRSQNWHDFFNALIWISFPKLKATLNAKQFKYIKQRWEISNARAPIENALTLFDEGGAIIVATDDDLISLLQKFNWQELLYHKRNEFTEKAQVIIFGHSLYEKALNPYVGITGNAVIVKAKPDFLKLSLTDQLAQLDTFLAKKFDDEHWILDTHPFQPIPILGIPGWHEANDNIKFYENQDYFRIQGKKKIIMPVELSKEPL